MRTEIDYNQKKSIRGAFGDELVALGEVNKDIVVLDADLSCSTKSGVFAKKFPDRFFNVGIAEQNLITTAAGLSLTGKIPFASTFAMFATGRTYDQIRNSVCYQHANVKIVGAHGGVTVGEDGASHQALEDVSLMRSIPNMTVIVPADYEQMRQAVRYAADYKGPVYIRMSRIDVPSVFDSSYKFNVNSAVLLKKGKDVSIFSCGDILTEVLKAADILKKNNIDAEVINVPVIKPLDKKSVIKSVKNTGLAVSVENHSVIGGLGSAIAECLSEDFPARLVRIGVNDTFGQSGTPKDLLKYYGLDAEGIAEKILEKLK